MEELPVRRDWRLPSTGRKSKQGGSSCSDLYFQTHKCTSTALSLGDLWFPGRQPGRNQVGDVLSRLAVGEPPAVIEWCQVDAKEEPAPRDRSGAILPAPLGNQDAALV